MQQFKNVLVAGVYALILAAAAGCATMGPDVAIPGDGPAGLERTALDDYVHAPDPHYRWEVAKTIDGEGYTGYFVKLVSQKYLTEAEVDRPVWEHWLYVARPDELRSDIGFLYIGGGNNERPMNEELPDRTVQIALATGTVAAELNQVPNQPLVFTDDGERRSEDEIIAYTWDKFMRTGDPKWPLRMAMTKSAVRAMDAITELTASEAGGGQAVVDYVVAGGSKRGWTTWTTAATDNRVIAIAPFVIDLLNVVPSFIHHWQTYGFYAPAVKDYEDENIMNWTGSPEYKALMELVEPFEYRERLTLPKYLVNATGDQFFLPDSSQFYFDELQGEKYLRYVPNADHGMGGTDAGETLISWYHAIVHNVPRPRFAWEEQADGGVKILALDRPTEVRLWQATNPDARDFRKDTIGDAYTSTPLHETAPGVYEANVPAPPSGWTAWFVELTYPSGIAAPFKFTTDVYITPDEQPFEFKWPTDTDHAEGYLSRTDD